MTLSEDRFLMVKIIYVEGAKTTNHKSALYYWLRGGYDVYNGKAFERLRRGK